MKNLVCLLEGPSEKELLQCVLPRLLPKHVRSYFIIFEGKQDLEKNLKTRLQHWKQPESCFLILRDQDSGDCFYIKRNLVRIVQKSGRSSSSLIRIACRELENFYLGDLAAVEKGLKLKGLVRKQRNKKFRNPDSLAHAAHELSKLTGNIYQKVAGSRAIAPFLKIDGSNKSHSFNVLLDGIRKIIE